MNRKQLVKRAAVAVTVLAAFAGGTLIGATLSNDGDELRTASTAERTPSTGHIHTSSPEPTPELAPTPTPSATPSETTTATEASEPGTDAPDMTRRRSDLPDLVPVSVDGWRFGVAWTGLDTDLGDDPAFTRPGETFYTFRVLIANIDDRRDQAPAGWALSPAPFLFYLDEGGCTPDVCESQYGDSLSLTCDTARSDVTGDIGEELIPLHGLIEFTCSTSTPHPDNLSVENFTVLYEADFAELTPQLSLQE